MNIPVAVSSVTPDSGVTSDIGSDPGASVLAKTERLIGQLAKLVAPLGYEIVDVSGHLDDIDEQSMKTAEGLHQLSASSAEIQKSAGDVGLAASNTLRSTERASAKARQSREQAEIAGAAIKSLADWAESTGAQFEQLREALGQMEQEADDIQRIAKEVHMLAINASIVAARAGESGRAFTVVANAINDLSQSTSRTAARMTENLQELKKQSVGMISAGKDAHEQAVVVTQGVNDINAAFGGIEETVLQINEQTREVEREAGFINETSETFVEAVRQLEDRASRSADAVSKAAERTVGLIDLSENLVALSADLGSSSVDSPFIEKVLEMAANASAAFEQGVAEGRISEMALFERHYDPIPGTDPQQFMAPFTEFTDQVLPPIQEEALDFDRKVVFCAAVDVNGYLPTHNLKFAKPQGSDPVWNAANCRNRRMFNDRVGLKAGRNTNRFLLQTYRRDMGGGSFVMMKDVSAPITVNGRHWGGLRFAYGFE